MTPLLWALLLLLIGLFLLLLEVFVPSAGVLSGLAAVALIAAVVVGFSDGPLVGCAILVAEAVLVPAMAVAAIRYWPYTPMGKLILIQRPKHQDDVLPERDHQLRQMVGKRGRVLSPMRPSGSVELEGRTYDAVSQGMALDVGQAVKVVALHTKRLVVRPVEAEDRLPEAIEPAGPDQPLDSPAPAGSVQGPAESSSVPPKSPSSERLGQAFEDMELGSLEDPPA